jgi:hypothetical protein
MCIGRLLEEVLLFERYGRSNGRGNLAPVLSPDPEQDLLKMGSDLELHLTSIAIAPTRNAKATTGNP